MLLGQHCSMLSTILFGIVTPDCGLIQAQQYCSILLTTRNNVAPTTLLHPVFNNLLQLIIFCRVRFATVEATSERCLIYRVFGVWFVLRVDSNRWILFDAHCWKI